MVSLQRLEPSEFAFDVGQWSVVQMCVSESPCVDEVRCLFLKLNWLMKSDVCYETSSLVVIHQMFVSEVDHHWH